MDQTDTRNSYRFDPVDSRSQGRPRLNIRAPPEDVLAGAVAHRYGAEDNVD
jgi:hypothetical protein